MSLFIRVYVALIASAFPKSESRAIGVIVLIEPVPTADGWMAVAAGRDPRERARLW
jgi:hypothetical protein